MIYNSNGAYWRNSLSKIKDRAYGVEHIPKEVKKNLGNKNIIINIYRIQYFCIGFIDFILKSKSLLYYRNLFSPNEYAQNDKSILKHFQ